MTTTVPVQCPSCKKSYQAPRERAGARFKCKQCGETVTVPRVDDAAAHMGRMIELHLRMMADSTIRRRAMADTAMRRLMQDVMTEMPPEHREHIRRMMEDGANRPEDQRSAPPPPMEESTDSAAHHGHQM